MRLYTFSNFYLSQIQIGIQTAHTVSNLFNEYGPYEGSSHYENERYLLSWWASDHKTIICLNGGNALDLRLIYNQLKHFCTTLKLPYTYFEEDEQSLNNCLTCVAVVVPEEIYNYDPEDVSLPPLSSIQRQLYDLIKSKRLA